MKLSKIFIIAIICLILFSAAAAASYTITGGTLTNVNVKGSSSQYNVGPSGNGSVSITNVSNNSGVYLSATGVTLDVASEDGSTVTFTKTISGQMGSSVTHSDSTNLINGGYSYGDGSSGANDVHTYSDTTQRTATYTVANDLQSLSLSASTTVFVPQGPTISAVSVSPTEGGPATQITATVTATASSGTLSYQWYQSSNSGSTWTAISGATSASSTFTLATPATYKFKVIVTDGGGSVDSYDTYTAVTATIYAAPTVTVAASKSEGALSDSVTLTATASGQGTLTYKWQQSTDGTTYADISGATSSTYTASINDSSATTHYYRALVTGTGGTTTSAAVTYHSNAKPVISAISANPTSGGLTNTVTLSATATGSGTLSYQWYEGTNALSGKTSASVTVSVSDSSAATHTYKVVVKDSYNQETTSSNVTYTSQNPPTISAVSATPNAGGLTNTVTLSATATGSGTLSYQWYEGTTALSGKTSASVTVSVSDSSATLHTYHVVVTDSNSQSTTSSNVTYQSYAGPTVSVSANKSSGGLSSSVTLTATATGQSVSYQWYEGTSAISGATSSTYTASISDSASTLHTYHVVVIDTYSQSATSSNVTYQTYAGPVISNVTANPTAGPLSQSVTLSVTASGENVSYQWYEGASAISGATSSTYTASINDSASTLHTYHVVVTDTYSQSATSSNVTYQSYTGPTVTVSSDKSSGGLSSSVTLTATATGQSVSYQWYEGNSAISGATSSTYTASINDSASTLHTYHVVVTDTYSQTATSSNVTYQSYAGPAISNVTADPTQGALTNTVTLSVTASGESISYQWYEGTSAISGATSATYQASINDSSATTHTYKVVVKDSYNQETTSSNVTYQSYEAPVISAISATPNAGGLSNTVNLSATVTGATTYQWYEGTTAIQGATSATYQASINDAAGTLHSYTLKATGIGGTTESSAVTYQSYAGPVISNVTVNPTEGALTNTVTLSVTASGENVSYQWYEGTTAISGATSATYQASINDSSATLHTYHAVVTDGYSQSATSSNVTYQSYGAPVISAISANPTEGTLQNTVTLSATVTGATTYQWYEGASAISGATSSTYTASINDSVGTLHSYTLTATGTGGTTESTVVTYQSYAAPVFTAIDVTPAIGPIPLTITATATASDATTYTWYESADQQSWTVIGTGQNVTQTYPSLGINYIKCVATGIGGTTESTVKQVQAIDGAVTISAVTVTPTTGAVGTTYNLSVTASAMEGVTIAGYQWYVSTDKVTWSPIATTQNASYTPVNAGRYYYKVVVTDSLSMTTDSFAGGYTDVKGDAVQVTSATATADKTEGALTNTVTLTATGTVIPADTTLSYQWYEGTSPISGATSSTYTASISDSASTLHTYKVVISANGSSQESSAVTYQSYAGPVISNVTADPTQGALTNTVTLSVTASGENVSYQWYEGTSAISGATSATYQASINDSSATLHTYHAVVTDEYGQSATSGNVTYQTYNPPTISSVTADPIEGPLSQTVTLTATASGESISYQWYEGTTAISGATSATYQASINDSSATTHSYKVVVTDTYSQTATSSNVTYQSYEAPDITAISANPTEGPLSQNVTLSATVTGATTYQWYEGTSAISGATSATYLAGINDAAGTLHSYTLKATGIGGTTESTAVTYQSYAAPTISGTAITPVQGPLSTTLNLSATVTGNVSGLQWQELNGDTWSNISGATTNPYSGAVTVTAGAKQYRLTATGLGGTTNGDAVTYTAYDLPTVTINVSAAGGALSSSVTLTATATGAPNLTYQWYEGASAISGATSSTYTANINDSSATQHTYKVVVNDYGGSAESTAVTYQTYNPPTISSVSANPIEGPLLQNVTLTATASGESISYQWYEGTSAISGATSSTYTASINDSASTLHTYKVVVTDTYSQSATSSNVTYQSYGAPVISSVTASTTKGPLDGYVSLTATVTDATTYQWFDGTNAIEGATTSSFTAHTTDISGQTHNYTLRATGIGGTVTSDAVTYTTYRVPEVTATISASTGVLNSSPVLTAATTDPDVTYQWYEGATAISGATSATYAVSLQDTVGTLHSYSVKASNYGGTGTSNTVTYQTYAAPTAVISANETAVRIPGTTVITANTTSTTAIQWQQSTDGVNFTNISGATSATYAPSFTTSGTFYYRLQATGYLSSVIYSNVVSIVSGTTPTVTITSPTNNQEISSGEITLTAAAVNATSVTWNLPGSSSNGGLNSANSWVRYTQSGTYQITVTASNQFGSATDTVTIQYGSVLRMKATETFATQSDDKYQTIINAVGGFDGTADAVTDIVEESVTPFTDTLGTALFYILIFGIPAILIWFASGSAKIPAIIGVVFSVFIMIFIPDAWGATIGIVIAVVIATGVLWLVAHRE